MSVQLRVPLSESDLTVVHKAAVKPQEVHALATQRTNREQAADENEDLAICNVENSQVVDEAISYVHVCAKCNVAIAPNTDTPDKDSNKKER